MVVCSQVPPGLSVVASVQVGNTLGAETKGQEAALLHHQPPVHGVMWLEAAFLNLIRVKFVYHEFSRNWLTYVNSTEIYSLCCLRFTPLNKTLDYDFLLSGAN